jgi:hypothetical protein
MENNFKTIFNKTKKGLTFKSELNDKSYINKANMLTEGQGHVHNNGHCNGNVNTNSFNDNKNKEKKNNLNTIDTKKEDEDLLSNKINKLKVSKNMKTKFNEINTITEKMKINSDNNELMESIKQKSSGINKSINDMKSRSN